ncbi:MAG: transcription elongation factor GreA [Gammaproteobacteria bacterium]|jgi:transcription elongation factor GreA|tara:strand:+ start:1015 stop:1491 length:477 start_codon:yes stop_codon:yes gene_type:complete
MEEREPMTVEGELLLKKELEILLSERPKISKEIAAAREFGDLKENAEYHAAKEQQGLSEARIREIESKLSRSQIIDILAIPPSGKIIFGTTIELVNILDDSEVEYKIVGEDEADVQTGKISYSSPLSRALISKEEGDIVKFESPSGIQEYEIISVNHR